MGDRKWRKLITGDLFRLPNVEARLPFKAENRPPMWIASGAAFGCNGGISWRDREFPRLYTQDCMEVFRIPLEIHRN